MPLRPINAIFYEPKQKFIVVYENGTLWQLPRMKIDMQSWRNKVTYKGDTEALLLKKVQSISDTELAKILPTEDLPENLWNRKLARFENWWQVNSYEWQQQKLADTDTQSQTTPIKTDTLNSSMVDTAQQPQVPQAQQISQAQVKQAQPVVQQPPQTPPKKQMASQTPSQANPMNNVTKNTNNTSSHASDDIFDDLLANLDNL